MWGWLLDQLENARPTLHIGAPLVAGHAEPAREEGLRRDHGFQLMSGQPTSESLHWDPKKNLSGLAGFLTHPRPAAMQQLLPVDQNHT